MIQDIVIHLIFVKDGGRIKAVFVNNDVASTQLSCQCSLDLAFACLQLFSPVFQTLLQQEGSCKVKGEPFILKSFR